MRRLGKRASLLDPAIRIAVVNRNIYNLAGDEGGFDTPDELDNLTMWLKSNTGVLTNGGGAATNGQVVATWQDQSGQNNHFTNAGAGTQPILSTNKINSLPAVVFAGTNDILTSTTSMFAAESSTFTVFWVVNLGAIQDIGEGSEAYSLMGAAEGAYGNVDFMWTFGDYGVSNHWECFFGPNSTSRLAEQHWMVGKVGVYGVFTYRIASALIGGQKGWFNGGTPITNAVAGGAISEIPSNHVMGLYSGVDPDSYIQMEVAELIAYSDALEDSEIESIHAYIVDRYGLTISELA